MKKTAAKTAAGKTSESAAKLAAETKKTAAAKMPVSVKPAKAEKPVKAEKPAKAAKAPKIPAAPAVKPAASAPKAKAKTASAVTTTIVAAVDVGFGNHLTLRGEGPGLSWESGLTMECVSDDRWTITLAETAQPIVCKFLINDQTWCGGEDYTVLPGASVVLSPSF